MHEDPSLSPRSARIVATHAALAGLCPLIPVPFVDDLAIRRIVRHMYTALFAAHGYTMPKTGAEILRASPSNRLRDAALAVALFPVKKVVRKLVYVLAVKDCAEVTSATYHDGWLLARVLEDARRAGHGPSPEDPAFLRRVREATLKTYEDVDPAPLRRALVGSFLGTKVGVRHGLRSLRRLLRDRSSDDAPLATEPASTDAVPDLIARVSLAAKREWQYMAALERSFRRHLGPPGPGDDAALDAPPA
jgi:uncharacterized protein (DUF697 family)